MIFTTRFLVLLGLGIAPLLLSLLDPTFVIFGVLWNIVCAVLALVDYFQCADPNTALTVERITDTNLSVATENTIAVRMHNELNKTLLATLRDEPPSVFALGEEPRQWKRRFGSFETHTESYKVTPPARGDFSFGDIFVRVVGPLGLVVRTGKIAATTPIAVYPNVRAVGDYEMMLRRAQTQRQGTRRIRVSGGGREFASLREYTPDDEYRHIDWKATARRGRVTVRTYEQERSQDILLLIDLGRLMRQEIAHTQKLDHVINAGLMLAHVVSGADDRIGLLTFSEEPQAWLPPKRGKAAVGEILNALYGARADIVESDYRAAFRFLASRWRKRSLAVLFTDLADPESSALLLNEIAQLARAHLVVCVVVSDPLMGERARQMPNQTTQVYEKAVAEEVINERRRALNILKKRGVLVVDAEPQDLSVDLVARYLEVKSRSMI